MQKLRSSIKSFGKSEADFRQELSYTRAELAAYQQAIVAITTIIKDPRDDLRSKCAALKEQFRLLEDQIKG